MDGGNLEIENPPNTDWSRRRNNAIYLSRSDYMIGGAIPSWEIDFVGGKYAGDARESE